MTFNPSNESGRTTSLFDYVGTRFPAGVAAPLTLLIVGASCAVSRPQSPAELAGELLFALLLVFEFRLWDDLCDRVGDREHHPERVLCRAVSVVPFIALLVVVALINFAGAALFRPLASLGCLLAMHGVLGVWYACRARLNAGPILNYHAVMLKYPAFVFVLGVRSTADMALPLSSTLPIVYLGLCVVEVLHDARLRQLGAGRMCAAIEFAILVVVAAAYGMRLCCGSG